MRQRVAVFVDGENIGASHANSIAGIADERGDTVIARVYGDVDKLNGWRDAARFTVVHSGTGKNATDILLSLEALDLALAGRFDICVIGSSDRDFSHLAVKLRERGLRVVGAGEAKTPKQFMERCSEFVTLGPTRGNSATDAVPPKVPEAKLQSYIAELIGEDGTDGWITVQLLGAKMHTKHGVRCSDLGARNWQTYLSTRATRYLVAS